MRTAEDAVAWIGNTRATAIMRWPDEEVAADAMDAAIRGGIKSVEFTLNTGGALRLIHKFAARGDVLVGAGTVLTVHDAQQAVEAGAKFLVSPVVDLAVIQEARRLGVAVMPGTYTPTEMWRAHEAGAQLQKLFPAAATGPAAVKSILGPMPFLKIVPTNGVTVDNAAEYLAAGAYAVGFVRALFDPADMANRNYAAIEARARAMAAAVQKA